MAAVAVREILGIEGDEDEDEDVAGREVVEKK